MVVECVFGGVGLMVMVMDLAQKLIMRNICRWKEYDGMRREALGKTSWLDSALQSRFVSRCYHCRYACICLHTCRHMYSTCPAIRNPELETLVLKLGQFLGVFVLFIETTLAELFVFV